MLVKTKPAHCFTSCLCDRERFTETCSCLDRLEPEGKTEVVEPFELRARDERWQQQRRRRVGSSTGGSGVELNEIKLKKHGGIPLSDVSEAGDEAHRGPFKARVCKFIYFQLTSNVKTELSVQSPRLHLTLYEKIFIPLQKQSRILK